MQNANSKNDKQNVNHTQTLQIQCHATRSYITTENNVKDIEIHVEKGKTLKSSYSS